MNHMDIQKKQFDFWYAVNHTEVLKLPSTLLETFGSTMVNYHLITEMMDAPDKIRIREGRIEAFKPQIITPSSFGQNLLEGFGQQADEYARWLREHQSDLMILQYGFSIRKREINDHTVSEPLGTVIERMRSELAEADDPMSSLVLGVEEPWEVCLLKLMIEVVQRSTQKHVTDLRNDPDGQRHAVEHAFLNAARDPSKINDLSNLLYEYGVFEKYQDRFFSLVNASR